MGVAPHSWPLAVESKSRFILRCLYFISSIYSGLLPLYFSLFFHLFFKNFFFFTTRGGSSRLLESPPPPTGIQERGPLAASTANTEDTGQERYRRVVCRRLGVPLVVCCWRYRLVFGFEAPLAEGVAN